MRKSKREEILNVAEKIAQHESASSVTLDRVADVAKISKGGLLYHFPTKDELLSALVERLIRRFDDVIEKHITKNPRATFLDGFVAANMSKEILDSSRGLVAVISYDLKLIKPLREAYKRWDKMLISDLKSEVEAMKIRFIFDGIFFANLFKLPMPKREVMESIFKSLK